jgi:hypothetical protein
MLKGLNARCFFSLCLLLLLSSAYNVGSDL